MIGDQCHRMVSRRSLMFSGYLNIFLGGSSQLSTSLYLHSIPSKFFHLSIQLEVKFNLTEYQKYLDIAASYLEPNKPFHSQLFQSLQTLATF